MLKILIYSIFKIFYKHSKFQIFGMQDKINSKFIFMDNLSKTQKLIIALALWISAGFFFSIFIFLIRF